MGGLCGWVARLHTGTIADLAARRFVGRALGKGSGKPCGHNSPWHMWRAVERALAGGQRVVRHELALLGFLHTEVRELFLTIRLQWRHLPVLEAATRVQI